VGLIQIEKQRDAEDGGNERPEDDRQMRPLGFPPRDDQQADEHRAE